jgi:UDP-4-amino-4-deoxy-L-arabinose formyltransferase/UDP-glucuronic acid dehydrogenase (UDP-4-keto-hexauronic acid decarboxylating)
VRAVVFAYHNLGVTGIEALLRHGFEVAAVFSHEDDPKEEVWFKSVKKFCQEHRLPVFCPEDVNRPEEIARIRALQPDIIFSFYYRQMLSPAILEIPPQGCLNLHGSLLPKYRGRAPVNWALIHGEKETGVTLHYMLAKPDAGDIVGQRQVVITVEDTALTLYLKMEPAAAGLLDQVLPKIQAGQAPRLPNRIAEGSYFGGRRPEDGKIVWTRSAWEIYNLVRALTRPYPGAFGMLEGEKFLVWRAKPAASDYVLAPGEIALIEVKALVGTGSGEIELLEAEYRGRTLQGSDLLKEMALHDGKRLI